MSGRAMAAIIGFLSTTEPQRRLEQLSHTTVHIQEPADIARGSDRPARKGAGWQARYLAADWSTSPLRGFITYDEVQTGSRPQIRQAHALPIQAYAEHTISALLEVYSFLGELAMEESRPLAIRQSIQGEVCNVAVYAGTDNRLVKLFSNMPESMLPAVRALESGQPYQPTAFLTAPESREIVRQVLLPGVIQLAINGDAYPANVRW